METSDGGSFQNPTIFPQHGVEGQRKLSASFPPYGLYHAQFDPQTFDVPASLDTSFLTGNWASYEQPDLSNGDAVSPAQYSRSPAEPLLNHGNPNLTVGDAVTATQRVRPDAELLMDPLEAISPNLDAVYNASLQSMLKPAGEEPALFARGNGLIYGYQHNAYIRSTGVMTEPSQNDDILSAIGTDIGSFDTGAGPLGPYNDIPLYAHEVLEDNISEYSATIPGAQLSPTGARPHAGRFSSDSQVTATVARGNRRRSSQPLPPCHICHTHLPKNRSDQLKHERKHTKPFKCRHAECRAKDVGFSTENDRDRHYKSGRHHEAPTKGAKKGFICVACTDGKMKWWPRQDNFKAHCTRRHANWNIEELMRRSEHATKPVDAYSDDNTTNFSDATYQQQLYTQQQDLYNFDIVQPKQEPQLLSQMGLQSSLNPQTQHWSMQ